MGEGRPAEVRGLGEFCSPEVCVLGKCRSPEVRGLGEFRPVEVCGLGEGRLAKVCGLGEGRPAEARVAVELGRRKITFLNRDGVEGIENGRSAEVEIKVTPGSWNGFDYFAFLFDSVATAIAHLNEDSAAYVLFFMKCRLIFGEISFIVIRL